MKDKKEDNYSKEEHKSENFFLKLIKKHIVVLILVLIIIGVFLYSMVRVNMLERQYEKQTDKLISEYNVKIDSLTISNMKLTARVFTWAIRSEMIRENREEVYHFFGDFIKEPKVTNIQLIDPDSFEVMLSTDKKDEGVVVENKDLYDIDELFIKTEPAFVKFINPVMGLDRKLGILVIKMDR